MVAILTFSPFTLELIFTLDIFLEIEKHLIYVDIVSFIKFLEHYVIIVIM